MAKDLTALRELVNRLDVKAPNLNDVAEWTEKNSKYTQQDTELTRMLYKRIMEEITFASCKRCGKVLLVAWKDHKEFKCDGCREAEVVEELRKRRRARDAALRSFDSAFTIADEFDEDDED